MKKTFLLLLSPLFLLAQSLSPTDLKRCQAQAQRVNIVRDTWGIPHVYGKSDADAVFGLLYVQCEDDFKRVEMNYIEKLGRVAELKGQEFLYNDLQMRLLIDSTAAIADYRKAEPWLKALLNAYADGINYYLHKNPQVKPQLLRRFEPWYPLLWTDGSIGAISTADLSVAELKDFYSGNPTAAIALPKDYEHQTGSNGFAFSPSVTESGHAILYINPHVTFYFRPEVQVSSQQGLNAYGAVTWGQFFVYQGFNEHCGWMHTSCNVDVADTYTEKISKKDNRFFYEYEGLQKPVSEKIITLRYTENGVLKQKNITTYATHHGPIMAKREGRWISLRSNNRSMSSLIQSWKRTKARGFEEYKATMELRGNTSNNTVFADAKGNIAYWHGNFVPKRNPALNWAKPVDGSTQATEWQGLHSVDETVHLYNPKNGWLQNCNSSPFSVAGIYTPFNRSQFPPYMAPDGENFRGVNATRVLDNEKKYTLDKVIAKGYDTKLSAFEILVPALVHRAEQAPANDSLAIALKEPIQVLKNWDYHVAESSVATTIAIEWAQKLNPSIMRVYTDQGESDQVSNTKTFAQTATFEQMAKPLGLVLKELQEKFGTWQKPWGEVNRFQRISNDLDNLHDDAKASFPVKYASALWGMLPSYNSRPYKGTAKRYGVGGNSFVCAVEFGPRIKAKSLLAGGNSSNPSSKHFADQAQMYAEGKFKDVFFYKEDVMKNAERVYKPGE